MASERLFLDTSFVIARFYRRDRYHAVANQFIDRVETCEELWTTEAVLLEIGAAFRNPPERAIVGGLWDWFEGNPSRRLAPVSGSLSERGICFARGRTRHGV